MCWQVQQLNSSSWKYLAWSWILICLNRQSAKVLYLCLPVQHCICTAVLLKPLYLEVEWSTERKLSVALEHYWAGWRKVWVIHSDSIVPRGLLVLPVRVAWHLARCGAVKEHNRYRFSRRLRSLNLWARQAAKKKYRFPLGMLHPLKKLHRIRHQPRNITLSQKSLWIWRRYMHTTKTRCFD